MRAADRAAQRSSGPQELRLQASGMNFAALAWGPEDGPLALCLHGYPDTAWTWRHLGPDLAERGWRVVAPFMRGYAPTDLAPDGGYQIGALAQDAVELHRALDGDADAVMIGHDWGAVGAYVAGSWRPGVFSRIVTLAVPPLAFVFGPLRSPRELADEFGVYRRQLPHSWYMLFQQFPGISERVLPRVIEKLWRDWSPGYDAREDLRHLAASLSGPGRRTAALLYYRALAQPWHQRTAYADPQSHLLGMPGAPVLYLHGRDDGCMIAAGAERTAQRSAEFLPPGSEVEIIEGAGHFLQLERPEAINPRIAGFIDAAR